MSELWATLAPILIVDVINPVLFATMVYAAGTRRAVINSSAILLGHTLAYLGAGIVLALGLEQTREKIEQAGGTIIKPIFSFPGGRRFHFGDPNGNEYAVWSDVDD
jgi:hypothetical protein